MELKNFSLKNKNNLQAFYEQMVEGENENPTKYRVTPPYPLHPELTKLLSYCSQFAAMVNEGNDSDKENYHLTGIKYVRKDDCDAFKIDCQRMYKSGEMLPLKLPLLSENNCSMYGIDFEDFMETMTDIKEEVIKYITTGESAQQTFDFDEYSGMGQHTMEQEELPNPA